MINTLRLTHLILNKLDVLDVKCLSFNIEPQHIGMSSIKKKNKVTNYNRSPEVVSGINVHIIIKIEYYKLYIILLDIYYKY